MKRLEQKEMRRQEILNAGLDLFIRKGYNATKTLDIAKKVGMSEGLLFHYFDNKEKLYLELLKLAEKGPERILAFKDLSPIKFFEKIAEQIIDIALKNPYAAKLFVITNQARYNEAISEKVRSNILSKNHLETYVDMIVKGQQDGSIREGDPIALTMAFFMAIQGIAENVARNPQLPIPKGDWIVDIIREKKIDKN